MGVSLEHGYNILFFYVWSKPSEQNLASGEIKKLGYLACWLVNGGFWDNLKE